mgnify:CR=1 FL=1
MALLNFLVAICESLKTPGPPQIGSCGGNTIGVLDFSPTFIIKPYHQKGGTEVPPYDIDNLQFVRQSTKTLTERITKIALFNMGNNFLCLQIAQKQA